MQGTILILEERKKVLRSELDAVAEAINVLRTRDGQPLKKGKAWHERIKPETIQRVEEVLATADAALTAKELGKLAGVSATTVRAAAMHSDRIVKSGLDVRKNRMFKPSSLVERERAEAMAVGGEE